MSTQRKWESTNKEFTPFWSFKKTPVFIGCLISKKTITLKDGDEMDIIEAVTEDGTPYNLPCHFEIEKTLNDLKTKNELLTLVKIEFVELKKLKGGKSVNVYNIFTEK